MLETVGYDLIYDKAGNTVKGVLARNLVNGTEYVINAGSVILATGGFGGSPQLMSQYNGGDWWLLGMAQNDGKMLQAAVSAGAGVYGMNGSMYGGVHNISSKPQLHAFDYSFAADGSIDAWRDDTSAWSLNDIPNIITASPGAIWVSPDGTRHTDESIMWAWPNSGPTYYAIVNQNWLDNIKAKGFAENRVELFCNAGFATFPLNTNIPAMDDVLSACLDAGIAVKADTIQMLAAKLNMNAATLAKTLNDYNDYCKTGVDAAFNKKSNYLVIMDRGPYYAFTAAPRPYSSIGGLDVNSALQVLMADGKTPIKGLYAGGTDCLGATAPAFGGELQLWAYMSGYFAAESAVR